MSAYPLADQIPTRSPQWYDLWSSYETPHIKAGIRTLALKPGERVVEVGCGTGKAAVDLAEVVLPGGQYTGLDISEQMLHVTRKRLVSAGDAISGAATLARADAANPPLPLGDGSADALFMSFTLELFDTPVLPTLLRECGRILRPDGRVVVVSMARSGGGRMLRWYEWFHLHYPKIVDCRPLDAAPLLEAVGFQVTSVEARSVAGLPVEVTCGVKRAQ